MLMKTQVLDRHVVEEIARVGRARVPNEACGLLLPTPHKAKRIWEMPNRSKYPRDSFEMHGSDMAISLEDWDGDFEDIVIWHTHPGGNVGPSRYDIENRVEKLANLVVSIPEKGKPLATWF
jgi:proteasome lid subunit RPN8/RPN11